MPTASNSSHGPRRVGGDGPLFPQPGTPTSRSGRSDVVPTFLRFSSLLNIELPISTSEPGNASPTKRSGTIGHDILNKIQYLFFQERDTYDRVLLELQACRPPVPQQSDPHRVVLDKLTEAARDVKTRKTPKTTGRRINVFPTYPDGTTKLGECDAPPSPTLQVKHNVFAHQTKRMPPPQEPPAVRFQHGLPTPKTSFASTTMTKSFTSNAAASSTGKLECSQASTAPTSTCPDDEDASQATEYTFSSIASEQAAELEAKAMMRNDKDIKSYARVTKRPFDRTPAESTPQSKAGLSKVNGTSSRAPAQKATPSLARHAPSLYDAGVPTPKPSAPNHALPAAMPANGGNASPSKGQHYRVASIPQDGITPFDLPQSCALLPLHVQAAAYSVMRAAKLSPKDFGKVWRSPRSKTLPDLAQQCNVNTRPDDWNVTYADRTFAAKWEISKTKDGPLFELTLHPPRLEPSCALQRKFGCDRFLIVDVPDVSENKLPDWLKGQSSNISDRIREMLARDHLFLGRRWAQLLIQRKKSKRSTDNQLDLAESGTSQVWFFAISGPWMADVSVAEVLNWAVPFAHNANQPACKAWARIDLAASRTRATVVFEQHQIMYDVDDQLSDGIPDDDTFSDRSPSFRWTCGSGKPVVMSDGCSMISVGAMKQVQQMLKLDYLPSAVQARILGAKGMWYISSGNPADGLSADDIWIKIAKSQIKARHAISDVADDQELRTLNVVNWSRKARSSILYSGFLPILRDRGVPATVILNMAGDQIDFDAQKFINALSKPIDLHEWIFSQKSLASMRRHNGNIQMNTVAGFPTVSDERAVLMLESGFEPCKNSYLRNEVLEIGKHVFSLKAKQFKVRLPASTSVYGICDPTGMLMPGEAHLLLSDPIRDEEAGKFWSHLDGNEVLVSRNPSRRNSDIQKIRLVYRTELAHIRDVIVFSSHGPRPLASKLSGGDYDGDTFWVCWDDALVKPFKNAPAPWEAEQKVLQLKDFGIEQDKVELGDIIDVSRSKGPQVDYHARQWIKRSTEMRMRTEWVGVVSNLHVALTYKEGTISSKLSSLLVDLHDLIIDADKQGYLYTEEAFSRWKAQVGMPKGLPKPAHAKFTGRREKDIIEALGPSKPNLRDVVDQLYFTIVEPKIDQALREAQLALSNASPRDRDLCDLFEQLSNSRSLAIRREIAALRSALAAVDEQYARAGGKYRAELTRGSQGRTVRTPIWAEQIQEVRDLYVHIQPVDPDNETVQGWLMRVGKGPTRWDFIKASALAKLQPGRTGSQMFNIAGSELCRLKAGYQDDTRTIRSDVYFNTKPQKRRREDDDELHEHFEHDFEQDQSDDDEFEIGASCFDDLDFDAIEKVHHESAQPNRKRGSNDMDDKPQTPPARRSPRTSTTRTSLKFVPRPKWEPNNWKSRAAKKEPSSSPSGYLFGEQAPSGRRTDPPDWQKRGRDARP